MVVKETSLEGVFVIEPALWEDSRGTFLELFNCSRYQALLGTNEEFVQDNFSRSSRAVLRGLHYQKSRPQGKLLTCLSGRIFDVVIDLRESSSSFGQSVSVILDSETKNQLWIPKGFAHGFCVLSESADFFYKCTDFYDPDDEAGLIWDDPDLAIDWPVRSPKLSVKDAQLPRFKDCF